MLEMFSFITKVKAQDLPNITNVTPPTSNFEITGLEGIINAIGTEVVYFAGVLALIAVIYSGIMYMTAGGDSTKAEKAKQNLLWAIIGIIIAFLAFIIIGWINNISTI